MALFYSGEGLWAVGKIIYPAISIEKGDMTFLTGPSGCGKSTYLRMLNRTLLPDQGQLFFEGKALPDYDVLSYRRKVLRIPQEPFLFDGSIQDNFNRYYETAGYSVPYADAIKEALELACLPISILTDCATLSGGERQRVFLALFLSFMPQVLLLDEPTAALDETTATLFFTNLKKHCLVHGITPVCICHQADLVKAFADRVICLGGAQ